MNATGRAPLDEVGQNEARSLTPRERQVAALVCLGLQNKEIAAALGTSVDTVRKQTIRIYEKTGLRGRVRLAAYWRVNSWQEARLKERADRRG